MKAGTVQRPSSRASRRSGINGIKGQVPAERAYFRLLTWMFTLFNSLRVLAYLPTVWAIQTSADSSQHSLWTWFIWLGANVTMGAWLYEHNGGRINRAIAVNIGNATMCLVTVLVITAHRW